MALPHRLFAVVSHTTAPLTHKQNVVEVQRNKLRELETKKAIDRASAVLDRLEQRVADYDAQLHLIYEQYVKPLEERRTSARRRIESLEDQILGKLLEANLERADGFDRQLQAVACPKAVQLDDLSRLPSEYIRMKPEADKVAIKRALEQDLDLVIPGVRLTQKVRLARK
jgi:hypothetical protein